MRRLLQRKIAVPVAVGAVVAALLVLTGIFAWQYRDHRLTEAARTDAVASAKDAVVAMLAYDYGNAANELHDAAGKLTPDFRKGYTDLVDSTIVPGAQENQLTVHVNVRGTAVISADKDNVAVLVFLNEVTTGKDNPKGVMSGTRARLEMRKVDNQWLVDKLTPI